MVAVSRPHVALFARDRSSGQACRPALVTSRLIRRLRPDKAPIEEAPPVPNASPRSRGAPDRERLSGSLVTKSDDLDLHKELRTSECASRVERAGKSGVNAARYTSFISSNPRMSERKTVAFT